MNPWTETTVQSASSLRSCASTSPRASRSPRRCWSTAAGLGVSSATVRHLLAGLEDEGYLSSLIPRPAGYRPTAAIAFTSTCCSSRSARAVRRRGSRRGCGATVRVDDRLAASAGLARGVAGVTQHRLCRSAGQRSGGLRSRRVRPAELRARPRGHRRPRRACHPEGHRRRRIASMPTISGRRPTISTPNSPGCRSIARARPCSSA